MKIDHLNTESMAVYAMLLNLFDKEYDENDEFISRFKQHILRKIENGENINV